MDRLSPLVAPVNPIKMFESLAAGVPVVAVKWKELAEMKAPISLASNTEEFASAIKRAIEKPGKPDAAELLARHSWDRNLDVLMGRIEEVRARRGLNA